MIRLDFIECISDEQLTELSAMAYDIWREFFPAVISTEQIEYMLEKFQSPQAMIKRGAMLASRFLALVVLQKFLVVKPVNRISTATRMMMALLETTFFKSNLVFSMMVLLLIQTVWPEP